MFNNKLKEDIKELERLIERAHKTLYGEKMSCFVRFSDYREPDKSPYYSIVDGVLGLMGRVDALEVKASKQQALLNELIDYVYRDKK